MKGKTWIVVTDEKNGKYFAWIYEHVNNNDLLFEMRSDIFKDAINASIATSKKRAHEIAEAWNNQWRQDGRLMSPLQILD